MMALWPHGLLSLFAWGLGGCGARSDILPDRSGGNAGRDASSDVANGADAADAAGDAIVDSPPGQDVAVVADAAAQVLLYLPSNAPPTPATWGWTGSRWENFSAGTQPPPRDQTAMASDGQEEVLFGGLDPSNELKDDTWTWKAGAWTERSLGANPGPRAGHAMAQLGSTAVLFSGYRSEAPFAALDDTWTFDGTSWTKLSPPSAPSPRTVAAFASMGDKAVLFGGSDSGGNSLDDTWVWDGATWSQIVSPVSPPASYGQALAPLGSSVVLFVPYDTSHYVTTWVFDGATWTPQSQGQTRVPSTYAFGLAANGPRVLLFGGYDEVTDSSQTHTYSWDGMEWSDLGASQQVTFSASQATPCMMGPLP